MKTVLTVDDEPAVLRVIKLELQSEGYTVLLAADGQAAIEIIQKNKLLAVLLDLHLQGPDGFVVLSQIKKGYPDLPVIMVTGSHDEAEARRAFDLGAWDYVTKPIDFNYLKNILRLSLPDGT